MLRGLCQAALGSYGAKVAEVMVIQEGHNLTFSRTNDECKNINWNEAKFSGMSGGSPDPQKLTHIMTLTLAVHTAQVISAPGLLAPLALICAASAHGLLTAGRQAATNMMHVTRALFAGALLAATAVVVAGPAELVLANLGPGKLSLYLDPLSVLMLGLVTFLGMIVSRYSFNYLAGDPGQARFSRWLVLTLASVSTLVISSNLLMFALAWVATSLSLHKLLLFYPERVGAVLAAKKKFIVSRIGDVCLLAALLLFFASDAVRRHGPGPRAGCDSAGHLDRISRQCHPA